MSDCDCTSTGNTETTGPQCKARKIQAWQDCIEAAAEARYRLMSGMDLPLEERAARARAAAAKTPLTHKTW